MSWGFPPVFSSRSFMLLGFTFRSSIHFSMWVFVFETCSAWPRSVWASGKLRFWHLAMVGPRHRSLQIIGSQGWYIFGGTGPSPVPVRMPTGPHLRDFHSAIARPSSPPPLSTRSDVHHSGSTHYLDLPKGHWGWWAGQEGCSFCRQEMESLEVSSCPKYDSNCRTLPSILRFSSLWIFLKIADTIIWYIQQSILGELSWKKQF